MAGVSACFFGSPLRSGFPSTLLKSTGVVDQNQEVCARFALGSLGLATLMSVFLLFDSSILGVAHKTMVIVIIALVAALVFAVLSSAREKE